MNQWWNDIPVWQRFVIFGLAVTLFVLGMESWVWSSLDHSMAKVAQDIEVLSRKSQESIQDIASLKDVEREVTFLRQQLLPALPQLPREVKPLAFRREIVDLGMQSGVSIHLWSPPSTRRVQDQPGVPLDIMVRVEGNFYGTVQFLEDLLQLPWIRSVNPLVLTRKQESGPITLVTTNFTIKAVEPEDFLKMKDLLKTL